MKGSVYFSHPIKTYNTEEEAVILRALKREFSEVINPSDSHPEDRLRGCKDCMQRVIRDRFFPLIEKCENFAIWDRYDTCNIECEIHYANQLSKPLFRVEYHFDPDEIDVEEVSLQEYYLMRRFS